MREKTGDLGSLALVEPAPTHGSEAPNWFPLAASEKPEQVVVKTGGYLGNVGLRVSRREAAMLGSVHIVRYPSPSVAGHPEGSVRPPGEVG